MIDSPHIILLNRQQIRLISVTYIWAGIRIKLSQLEMLKCEYNEQESQIERSLFLCTFK